MQKKNQRVFVVFILLISLNYLFSFTANQYNFTSFYQFEMFNSWLKKAGVKNDNIASLSKEKIIMQITDESKNKIDIVLIMKNWKVIQQLEKVKINANENYDFDKYHTLLEEFIFRINTVNKRYIQDFISDTKTQIYYENEIGSTALNLLWNDNLDSRINIESIDFIYSKKFIGFKIYCINQKDFSVYFKANLDLKMLLINKKVSENFAENELQIAKQVSYIGEDIKRNIEFKIERVIADFIEKQHAIQKEIDIIMYENRIQYEDSKFSLEKQLSDTEKKISFLEEKKTETVKLESNKLSQYFTKNHKVAFSRILLNNKIQDFGSFLKKEFPSFRISREKNSYTLYIEDFRNELSGEISLLLEHNKDGINVYAEDSFVIQNNKIVFSEGCEISKGNLSENEFYSIAPYINQLLITHRTIGTELLNFLLFPGSVSTKVIINGTERRMFNVSTYTNCLLMLSKYWANRIVYFNITGLKKVNNYIELRGSLAAVDNLKNKYDYAEIRFHLDKNLKMDLVMMSIYPELQMIP